MADVGVIDTGVLIGFTIKNDQHHETTRDYILDDGPPELVLPPQAKTEYDNIESWIRRQFHQEIAQHRQDVQHQVRSDEIQQDVIQYIRDGVLDDDEQERSYDFLYRWYTTLYEQEVEMEKKVLVKRLSNMETEPYQDRSKEWGGWRSHIDVWTRGVDRYNSLRSRLLLQEDPDLTILIEAHYIACESNPKGVEFGTANPSDFIHHRKGEPKSREDDILDETRLEAVRDLAQYLDRHYPDS